MIVPPYVGPTLRFFRQKKIDVFVTDNLQEVSSSPSFLELLDVCRHEGVPVLAVLSDRRAQRAAVFRAGFWDYIGYPFIAAEVEVRLSGIGTSRFTGAEQIAAGRVHPTAEQVFPQSTGTTPHEIALVTETCAFLQKDVSAHRNLDDLAHRMGANRNSLARAFKRVLGKGAYAWLREQRMIAATKLLETTGFSIQEISFAVGYEDSANFSTAFKQLYGVSPRAYRKLVRKSKV